MRRRSGQVVPAVRPGLLSEQVGRECVVFDTESNDAHCLAPLAAAVFAHCDGRTRIDDLPALVSGTLGEPVGADDVEVALEQLADVGLLASPVCAPGLRISRRSFVRTGALAAAGVAGAAVLVTTVATPATALASDRQCGTGLRCVSQSAGDDFCGCTSTCGGEGAAVAKCQGFGLGSVLYFDSCECVKCATSESEGDFEGEPYEALEVFCPPVTETDRECGDFGAEGYPNGGCLDDTKPMDGICVPQSGDTTEQCA